MTSRFFLAHPRLRSLLLFGILLRGFDPMPEVAAQSAPPDAGEVRPLKPTPFPDWMDAVTFPGDKRSLQGPQEPVDPDPNSSVRPPAGPGEKARIKFNPPRMPDLSALRKKGWKSSYQRIGSDSQALQQEQFSAANLEAERKRQYELGLLLDAFPPGPQRDEIGGMLRQQQGRVAAAEELLRLIGSGTGLASMAVELGTRALAEPQSASNPLSPLLDIGGSATLDLGAPGTGSFGDLPAASMTGSMPGVASASGTAVGASAPTTPARDARTARRVRELLQVLYPAVTPELAPPKAPTMGKPLQEPSEKAFQSPGVSAATPAGTSASSPANAPSNAPSNAATPGKQPPSAKPDAEGDEVEGPDSREPARIPERFYRPSATPSLYREKQEGDSGE